MYGEVAEWFPATTTLAGPPCSVAERRWSCPPNDVADPPRCVAEKPIIMWKVYILRSLNNNKVYIGYTENLEQRLSTHNSGKVRSTKAYMPYKLVHTEAFQSKTEARKREIFLKSGKGREFVKSVVNRRAGRVVPATTTLAGPQCSVAEKPIIL